MIKKKLIGSILLAAFTCVTLFSLAACNSTDQSVYDRLDTLESGMNTLETKVEALEAANANFRRQLAALDSSSDTFTDDLAKLTSNYNNLTESVQNATHIERVVVTKEDVETNPLIKDVGVSSILSSKTGTVSVSALIRYNVTFFPYHLAVCKVNLIYEENMYNYSIPIVKENADESGDVSSVYSTDIKPTDISAVTADWIELVLYKLT